MNSCLVYALPSAGSTRRSSVSVATGGSTAGEFELGPSSRFPNMADLALSVSFTGGGLLAPRVPSRGLLDGLLDGVARPREHTRGGHLRSGGVDGGVDGSAARAHAVKKCKEDRFSLSTEL